MSIPEVSFVSKQQLSSSLPVLRKLLPYRGCLGPPGPKLEKESENEFPGPLGPGAQKVEKESKKSRNRLFFNYVDSLSTSFSTFWAPGTHFPTLFPALGLEGPNDPCSRARESQRQRLLLVAASDAACSRFFDSQPQARLGESPTRWQLSCAHGQRC